uniref:Uncharacterized protein n=1 Tax=Sphaerodactylus townsendi TaxID=933632 RepID=A0ACB8FT60_9SAUR
MSDSLVVCDVDPDLKEKLKTFRFRKETNNAAIIMKVDKDKQLVVLEEEFQGSKQLPGSDIKRHHLFPKEISSTPPFHIPAFLT